MEGLDTAARTTRGHMLFSCMCTYNLQREELNMVIGLCFQPSHDNGKIRKPVKFGVIAEYPRF